MYTNGNAQVYGMYSFGHGCIYYWDSDHFKNLSYDINNGLSENE